MCAFSSKKQTFNIFHNNINSLYLIKHPCILRPAQWNDHINDLFEMHEIIQLMPHQQSELVCLWIIDFLSSRRQQVSVNGSLSSWIELLSGIPQGSVLGPVLFILYINDLSDFIGSFTMLFADDTNI